jgi:hypothetical protein
MSDFSPARRLTIAKRVAEMLALPHRVCRHRTCRRAHLCRYYFAHSGQPACLNNLDTAQRAIFEELRADTEHVASRWGFLMLPHYTSSVSKEVREMAIEIVHSLLGKADLGRFTEWRRKRAAEMAPRPPRPVAPPAPAPEADWPHVEFTKVKAPQPLIRVL